MLVLGRITASNVPARQAQSQVKPGIANPDAVFTIVFLRPGDFDFAQVCATRRGLHWFDHRDVLVEK
jgi:hypothetical protein